MISSVHQGFFPDGPDLLLLNPNLPPTRWRRERTYAALRPSLVLIGLIGVLVIAIGVGPASGFAAALLIGTGAVIVGLSAFGVSRGRR
ncbi:hypothetical protein ACPZ19_40885 [Amycolatopsis lurida]